MARIGHCSNRMSKMKKKYVPLVFSVILCVVALINFTTFFSTEINIKEYARNLIMYPWKTVKSDSYNSDCLSANNKESTLSYSASYWDTLLNSDVLTGKHVMEYFMWTNRSSCRLAHDFGGKILGNPSGKDGQKTVCIDPAQVAPQPRKCLVYSFGISNEWSFDEEMEKYGCEVFAFDPSMKMEPHDHSRRIHFYNWGLSDRDEKETRENGTQWQMYSLSSVYNILSARHGTKIIDYLKMDIEGSEWKVLTDIMKTGMLSKVRQLGLEIHLPNYPVEGFRQLVRLVRALESMGMVRFDSKYNPWYVSNFTHLQLVNQPAGYEVAWYNSLFV